MQIEFLPTFAGRVLEDWENSRLPNVREETDDGKVKKYDGDCDSTRYRANPCMNVWVFFENMIYTFGRHRQENHPQRDHGDQCQHSILLYI